MSAVLALDQGTTGSTALVVAEDGRVLGRGYREIPQHFPAPGEVEHDPEEILAATIAAAREALAQASVRPVALGITNQRETVCVWERDTGRAVHRALVWQDRRTARRCAALAKARKGKLIGERTGLVLDPYFSATKLEWMLRNHPGLRGEARRGRLLFGTVDSWVLWKLSGGRVHATDPTNASRTLLYDIGRQRWDDSLLDIFGIPAAVLPEVRPSSGVFGETHGAGVLADGIRIAGIAGDQQAALFGQGCVEPGQSKNTYGTGCFLLLNTGDRRVASRAGLLTTVACGARGEPVYALEGSVFIAGAALQWLRDGLGIIESAPASEAVARSVEGTGGVVMVPAFVGLGAPYWRPEARGAVLGLTRGTTRAHVSRAALESMAFQTRDVLEAMERDASRAAGGRRVRLRELRVDGGAAANDLLLQVQADLIGIPVVRPRVLETTALGAALLAGLATGMWANQADVARARQVERTFTPRRSPSWRGAEMARWRAAVAGVLAEAEARGRAKSKRQT